MNIIDELNRWKRDNIDQTEQANLNANDKKYSAPLLLYTHYSCPYFIFYLMSNKPYLFPPFLSDIIKLSFIIESYLSVYKILVNPAPNFLSTEILSLYINQLNYPKPAVAFELYSTPNNFKRKKFSFDKKPTSNKNIPFIINLHRKIIKKRFNSENQIQTEIQNLKLQNFYSYRQYSCNEYKCPFFHVCKMKQ